ncbi:MAG: IS110 family transposase [Thermomicrobiales bacterium]
MHWIGVDCHKWQHTAALLNDQGQILDWWQGDTTPAGWQDLLQWVQGVGDERQWGLEGSGNYGRGLAQFLVTQGEVVYEVNTRLTVLGRRGRGRLDKSDQQDAVAIAAVVRAQAVRLPRIQAEDISAILALLTHERDDLQAAATRVRNQLHALIQQLEPGQPKARLQRPADLEQWQMYEIPGASPLDQVRVEQVRRRARQLAELVGEIDGLEQQIRDTAPAVAAPLIEIVGVGLLTAGMLAGYLGPGRRFASERQLAAYAGVAPLEVSSAGRVRHRLNRNGHRQLNAIMHRIALSQVRHSAEAKTYVAKRRAQGKSYRDAIRALKRYIVRRIYRQWQRCLPLLSPEPERMIA